MEQTHATVKIVEFLVGLHLDIAGEAESGVESEIGAVGDKAVAHSDSTVVGSDIGEVHLLLLVVDIHIIDVTLGTIFRRTDKDDIGIIYQMVTVVTVGEDL